ncbi:MAG: benzoate-CoA ligase family protein [Burkholderiaceae bacterium]
MSTLSRADYSQSPPLIDIPRLYNAAVDLIDRNLAAGRADKLAFIDDSQAITFGELSHRVDRFAHALSEAGVRREERIFLCMLDTVDWPVAFLGAIKAGVIPVAANTLLKSQDYEFMLADSKARLAFVSEPLLPEFAGLAEKTESLQQLVSVSATANDNKHLSFFNSNELVDPYPVADTTADDACFWLYSSGSTGQPKGTVHVHASLIQTAQLYAVPVLGLRESDVVFSAAKLFFAYGLGNGLSFPMAVGATALLMSGRPTPESVFERITGTHQPTVFYGVPTLFAAMLASPMFPPRDKQNLRVSTSAGEALPEDIGKRWRERTGVDILDGIGSTEMLHIFLSNHPGNVRYGTTGQPVPGYELKLLSESGDTVSDGEIGDLYICGPTAASMYWNQREKTRETFQGKWTRSGDKYTRDADGFYTYAGRSDDMLKVSGQYVSPFEVESALATHEAVLEAAVVGTTDDQGLTKPKAWVVLNQGVAANSGLAAQLQAHVKDRLAPFKYPRWIEFVDELPKTATGKIQRFRLRN